MVLSTAYAPFSSLPEYQVPSLPINGGNNNSRLRLNIISSGVSPINDIGGMVSPGAPTFYNTKKTMILKGMEGIKEYLPDASTGIPHDMIGKIKTCLDGMEGKTILAIRNVEPAARVYLEKKHPTKNFHIKGKSSNWGPQIGLIPVDQRLSKLAKKEASPVIIEKLNAQVAECIADGFANAVHLRVDKTHLERCGFQFNQDGSARDHIEMVNGHPYHFRAQKKSADSDEYSVDVNGNPLNVLAYPKNWLNEISDNDVKCLTSYLDQHPAVQPHAANELVKAYKCEVDNSVYIIKIKNKHGKYFIDGDFVNVINKMQGEGRKESSIVINNRTMGLRPCQDVRPITADLDILCVYSDDVKNKKPLVASTLFLSTPRSRPAEMKKIIDGSESKNNGNVTREIICVASAINNVMSEDIIHHSAEANNPYAGKMEDNLPATYIFSDSAQRALRQYYDSFNGIEPFINNLEKGKGVVSVDTAEGISSLSTLCADAHIPAAWNPDWNKNALIEHSPTEGHAKAVNPLFFIGNESDLTD